MLLAIGRDVIAGKEISDKRCQIDLAPTTAHLLSFSANLTRGTNLFNTDYYPPFELINLDVYFIDNKIFLNWTASSEISNQGYIIKRSFEIDGDYVVVASYDDNDSLKSKGYIYKQNQYSYCDENISPGTVYWYKIITVSIDSIYNEYGPIYANIVATDINRENSFPNLIPLIYNYPNPFNYSTKFKITMNEPAFVTLTIYNEVGQEVITLVAKKLPPGNHHFIWNAFDLSSSIYFYRLKAGINVNTGKMILLK
jgi:hypothetical protein